METHEITTSTAALKQQAERWSEIKTQIERLNDEAAQTVWPLERAAQQLASAEHKLKRTTSHCHFDGLTKDGAASFEIIDGYDDSYEGYATYTFEQLADPDAAIAKIKAARQESARKRAEEELTRAQQRLAQLQEASN